MIRYADSPIHGSGAFAAKDILRGTFLTYYLGEVIDPQEALKRINASYQSGFTMIYKVNESTYIDGSINGNGGPLFNHSCSPNCIMVKERDQLALYTKQFVAANTELTYDYGLVLPAGVNPEAVTRYACRCGSPNCRGTMLAQEPA